MVFSIKCDEMEKTKCVMAGIKEEILCARHTIEKIINDGIFSGGENAIIKGKLEQISEALFTESNICGKLAAALDEILLKYKNTEAKLTGIWNKTDMKYNFDAGLISEFRSITDIWSKDDMEELLENLGDNIYQYIINEINHMSDEELLEWYEMLKFNSGPWQFVYEKLGLKPSNFAVTMQYLSNYIKWNQNKIGIGDTGYIEFQEFFGEFEYGTGFSLLEDELFDGNMTAKDNMCEVIAVYNALTQLGDGTPSVDLPELLYDFSKDGIALNGCIGTSPVTVNTYLNEIGYDTDMLVGDEICQNSIQQMQDDYDTYILTAYNEAGNVEAMIHTVSITCEGEPRQYYVHNNNSRKGTDNVRSNDPKAYNNDYLTGYDSLQEAVDSFNNGKGDPISVIGIR